MRQAAPTCGVALALLAAVVVSGCAGGPFPITAEGRKENANPREWMAGQAGKAGPAGASEPGTTDVPSARTQSPRAQARPSRSVEAASADVLVVSDRSLDAAALRRLRAIPGVSASTTMGTGSTAVGGDRLIVAAVRPSEYRPFTPPHTAEADRLWAAVARGEAVVAHSAARRRELPLGGEVTVTTQGQQTRLRIGAFAATVPRRVDVVVNRSAGQRLGVTPDTAVVLSAGRREAASVADDAREAAPEGVSVEVLSDGAAEPAQRRAFLSGGQASEAFGSFHYRYYPDGTIEPDAEWVAANIRTEKVPILGHVTCHRLMFPQLRGALREIARRGLADTIHPDQYGGCYVPRFIGRDPNNGISLHTWGIALDLNVAGNQRGTDGQIDPRTVRVLKGWGFAWGGDWDRTDPMHFQLSRLLEQQS